MNAEIISVGTELLLGDIVNSDSQFLSRELATYGMNMLYQSTVGDNAARLGQMLTLAMSRSELILITGGLGPTQDDLTRETICATLNLPMELHEESWERIQQYFQRTGRVMTENNRKQAMLPKGCIVFPNDCGTAPGCAIERYGQSIVLLPGPPRELIPMFQKHVTAYLSKFSGGTIYSRTIGVFGMPESTLAERIADLMSGANPTVAPYAKDGEVVLRVTAYAADIRTAQALCDPVVEDIRQRLSVYIYGVDVGSLQNAVVTLLKDKKLKIATAESCTAGLLSSRLTEVAGVSSVFECGIAAYSNDIKQTVLGVPAEMLQKYGAVSPEVACAMAIGVRRVSHASLGIGITGVAGPDSSEGKPVGVVYIALADEKRTWVKKIVAGHGPEDREYVRYISTSHALDLSRRYLEAMPAVMAGGETIADTDPGKIVIPAAPTTTRKRSFLAAVLPWKGDSKAEMFRKAGIVLVLLMLIIGCAVAVTFVLNSTRDEEMFEELQDLYSENVNLNLNSIPEGIPNGILSQFIALYNRNSDIKGWVKIENTKIHYPVMQSDDTDSNYYQNHNFEKQFSTYGVPYFDKQAAFKSSESINRSLVIYGNNTHNDQMFSSLTQYTDLTFLINHPMVEMSTIYQASKWKVFGVMIVSTKDSKENNFDYTRTDFPDGTDFMKFVSDIQQRSLFTLPVDVTEDDSLLLLSTNASEEAGFNGAQLILAARMVRADEAETVDLTGATTNSTVMMPKEWNAAHPNATTSKNTGITTTKRTYASSNQSEHSTTLKDSSDNETTHPDSSDTTSTTVHSSTTATTSPVTTPGSTTTTTEVSNGDLISRTALESEQMSLFHIENASDNKILTPSTREELQLYVSCLVKKEMGSKSYFMDKEDNVISKEALKAQAVVSYTKALYDFTHNSSVNSLTISTFSPSSDIIDETIYGAVGEVLGYKILDTTQSTIKNALCNTMYFSYSAGYTANSEDVFSSSLPYLRSVTSDYDVEAWINKYSGGVKSFDLKQPVTLATLKENLTKNLSEQIMTGYSIEYESGTSPIFAKELDSHGNYVIKTNAFFINKNGVTQYVTGQQMRTAAGLNSPCFEVFAYDADTLTFKVTGNGHGVGMSQYGAIGYANNEKWTYDQILSHYYSITSTSKHQLVKPIWE